MNVKSAVVSPSAVGVYVTSNTWFPPGNIIIGNMPGVNVYCVFDELIFVITRFDVPGLLTVA